MNSLSALAELNSSDEENENMKDILSNLCEGDVVRFCVILSKQNFPGRITGIRRNGLSNNFEKYSRFLISSTFLL